MSLLQSFLKTLKSWRRRRGGPKTRKGAGIAVEQLDHRQLLTVNFTGNVPIDFPAPTGPGVVIVEPDATDQVAEVPAYLNMLGDSSVLVSGFNIKAIYVSYDSQQDILSIGLDQPDSGRGTGRDVIAGDADNNGNSGNPAFPPPLPPPVDPVVAAAALLETGFEFRDHADLAGGEGMFIFLDLKPNDAANMADPPVAEVVAGFSNDPLRPTFEVAKAVTVVPGAVPTFGQPIPQAQGSFYLNNDPLHPNLQFQVARFSELYLAETGEKLKPNTTVGIGAFAGSDSDDGIQSTVIKLKPFVMGDATEPVKPCPPIVVNPHRSRHINTAHPTDVRVHVLGTPNFKVRQIDPETVQLDGASPYLDFEKRVNGDPFPDRTFVFNSIDLDLPGGLVDVVLSGELEDGTPFHGSQTVFVRNDSFYSPQARAARDARREAGNLHALLSPLQQKLYHNGLLDVAPVAAAEATPAPRSVTLTELPDTAVTISRRGTVPRSTVVTPGSRAFKPRVTTPTRPVLVPQVTEERAAPVVKIATSHARKLRTPTVKVMMNPAS